MLHKVVVAESYNLLGTWYIALPTDLLGYVAVFFHVYTQSNLCGLVPLGALGLGLVSVYSLN